MITESYTKLKSAFHDRYFLEHLQDESIDFLEHLQDVTLCELVENYKQDIDLSKLVLLYDDGCHLDYYKRKESRKEAVPGITDIVAAMKVFIDKYHQSNHTACGDEYNIRKIVDDIYQWVKSIKTEVCEETFSWFKKYKHSTTQMTGAHFRIVILYLLCRFNEQKIKERRQQTENAG
eukprot:314203_1